VVFIPFTVVIVISLVAARSAALYSPPALALLAWCVQ